MLPEQPYVEISDESGSKCLYPKSWTCIAIIVGIILFLGSLLLTFFLLEVTCVPPKLHEATCACGDGIARNVSAVNQDAVTLLPRLLVQLQQATPKSAGMATCVCGKSPPVPAGMALLVQTACGTGDRLAKQPDVQFVEDFDFKGPSIEVNVSETDQKVIGFGGALTQASSSLYKDLKPKLQKKLLDLYFGEDGIGYTVGRIPINSCDFSPEQYSFDDVDGDFHLKHFDSNVKHDQKYQIPFIKKASQAVSAHGDVLRLIASPWSPPAWMKTNNLMAGNRLGTVGDFFGFPRTGSLRPECRATWANYISRWVDAYKAHGVDLWAVTLQNEPSNTPMWEACTWTPAAASDFLGSFLGPTLERKHPNLKIFVGDDQTKTTLPLFANATFSHLAASKYATGIAFHWYGGSGSNIRKVHHTFPQAILLASEATYDVASWNFLASLKDGIWRHGEGYAQDIIGDLNAGASGWLDWNILLNDYGGPNHIHNNCDAAVVVSEAGNGDLWIRPQYYFIGHFSKYILPDSVRLGVHIVARHHKFRRSWGDWMRTLYYTHGPASYGFCAEQSGLQATSFLRPDDIAVVVVLSCSPVDVEFKIRLSAGRKPALKTTIPAHAIQTYLFKIDAA